MARPSRWSWLLALGLVFAETSSASAQSSEITVAVYAPWAGPSSADERFAFGAKLSDAIAAAGLGRARVSSFVRLADFRRALSSTRVDIALVDAGAISALGNRLKVAASHSSGERWLLAAASRPTTLQGKRLALQAADAPSSKKVVERLLRKQVDAQYFASIVGTPVTADARQLVLRGGADLVLVPQSAAADLTALADLGTFTELAIAIRHPSLSQAANTVQQAVRQALGGEWSAGAPRFPASVALTLLQTAVVETRSVSFLDLLARRKREPPTLATDEMWIDPSAK